MSQPIVHLHTRDGFEPSPRLRVALERLAMTVEAGADGEGSEVAGFAAKGRAGELGSIVPPGASPWWNDGCWGYTAPTAGGDGGCNWYQKGDYTCVGATFLKS